MRIYTLTILMLFLLPNLTAQGYEQWKANQEPSTHLQANYKSKKTYFSSTGKTTDFYLKQYQQYNEKGRLIRDVLHKNRLDEVYDIRIEYKDSMTARSFNKQDNSTAIYKFSKTGKITYYLTEDKVGLFINYQYDSLDRLLSCKDCMAPFGNAVQCAYYQYFYDNDHLVKVKQFSVSKVQLAKAGQLYATDSLVYQNNLLVAKYFKDETTNQIVNKNIYEYNKKDQCIKKIEYIGLVEEIDAAQLWTTTYKYRPNGKFCHSNSQQLLLGDSMAAKSIKTRYNQKGLKISVYTNYLKDGRKKRFIFEYK